jgi:hypothetical protein
MAYALAGLCAAPAWGVMIDSRVDLVTLDIETGDGTILASGGDSNTEPADPSPDAPLLGLISTGTDAFVPSDPEVNGSIFITSDVSAVPMGFVHSVDSVDFFSSLNFEDDIAVSAFASSTLTFTVNSEAEFLFSTDAEFLDIFTGPFLVGTADDGTPLEIIPFDAAETFTLPTFPFEGTLPAGTYEYGFQFRGFNSPFSGFGSLQAPFTFSVVVPEPATAGLLGLGFVFLAGRSSRWAR